MQSRRHHRARHARAQHRIAVIQQAIDAHAVLVAMERAPEHQRPVAACGLGLDIVGIARAHFARQQIKAAARCARGGQRCALRQDLGAHELCPKPLLQGQARRHLVVHAPGLNVVGIDRPDDGGRHVVRAAQHHRHAARRQLDQRIVGVSQAMRVGDDRGDVVHRHAADFLAALGHDEKAAVNRQVPPVRRDLHHPPDHRPPAYSAARAPSSGGTRQSRPSSSIRTRSAFNSLSVP